MSKSGTWPGVVTMESESNMESVGSFDSVISMNSGYSDDSMEHLTAEERACLMYLEETIEALEVQEDSGLSNDEPDAWSKAGKNDQVKINDIYNLACEGRSCEVPIPLTQVAAEPAPSTATFEGKTEDRVVNQNSEPQSPPAAAVNRNALKTVEPVAESNPAVTGSAAACTIQSSVNPAGGLGLAFDRDCDPETARTTSSGPGQSTKASEIDVGLIPPPSDFMDEPDTASRPEEEKAVPPPAGFSTKPEATFVTVQLHPEVCAKQTSVISALTEDPFNKPPPSQNSPLPGGLPEPRSPPAVAPKPKKIPANIILNSQKTAATGSDGNSGHSVTGSSDRVMLDPQRVRMEALRKLGLLRSNEEHSNPALSPKLPTKTRKSWAAPSPPVSPAALDKPLTTLASDSDGNSPPSVFVPLLSVSTSAESPSAASPAPPSQGPDILPAPAAFSDPTEQLPSDNDMPADNHGTEVSANTRLDSPPEMVKHPTPTKVLAVKSATLERSGLGLSRSITHQLSAQADQHISSDLNPRQWRNSRPRPASLGSGKEFTHAKGEDLQAGHATSQQLGSPSSAHTAFQHSRGSAKLPRSQGISVLICPRGENGENRREALKKLGLLRD